MRSSRSASAKFRGSGFSRRMVALFVIFAGVYFCLPPVATLIFPRLRGEIYPLSMWSMFYRVHNRVDDFGLRVLTVNDKARSGSPYFESAQLPRSKSIAAYHAIQKLGREVAQKDKRGIARTRHTVEDAYLSGAHVQYEIVKRSWDPYERFRNGTFVKERTLAQLESLSHPRSSTDSKKRAKKVTP